MIDAAVQGREELSLRWLVRLRWCAVLGQVAALAFARRALDAQVPVVPFVAIVLLTAISNLLVTAYLRSGRSTTGIAGTLLVLDTLSLTALLQLAGGPSNPFSTLYLVHVTLGAVVVGARWAWLLTALAVVGYAVLFFWYVPIPQLEHTAHHHGSGSPFAMTHYQAMWVALTVSAVLTVAFVVRLSTALERRGAEFAAMRERALRAERLAAVTTLAAGAAHELGTPLGTIAVAASELERSLAAASPSDRPSFVADARRFRTEVDRSREVLRRIVSEGGEIAGEALVTASAPEIAEGARASLGPKGAARVVVEEPVPCPRVLVPRRALERALRDVLRNALEASPEGASVLVRIEGSAGRVRITTLDEGAGLSPEALARVGEPFFSTRPPGHGLGLGLFLARTLCERLGGRLVVAARPRGGAAVTIELPAEGSAA